jgi:N-acetylneuraminate synthase
MNKQPEFLIGGIPVGLSYKPVVVAEIGINHGGKLDDALLLAKIAIDNGARIIKHQTHIPDFEMSIEARSVVPGNAEISIYDVISNNSISLEDEIQLSKYVTNRGAIYLSTPFSREAADFLNSNINVPAFKIGSGECNNYPLVEHIAKLGKPIILSTGMNTIDSIIPSVQIFRKYDIPYALLHCTNLYPTADKLVRLEAINDLKNYFPDAVIGLSDHSLTNYPCLGAVALGASILERHFTDSKERIGPDIVCSMTPVELVELISGSEIIHNTLGSGKYATQEEEITIAFAFSSVVATRDINVGEKLSPQNIWVKRPSGGDFSPSEMENLYGKNVVSKIPANTQLKKGQID